MQSSPDLAFATIAELSESLHNEQVSPVELATLALERLATVGTGLNAVVTVTAERAMREAELVEQELRAGYRRGPLQGIPYGVKDLLATAGDPTTWGAAPLREQTFPSDAELVTRLRDAGGVLTAKLALTELAGGFDTDRPENTFTGPAINPWNRAAYCGGSSGGTAAAVAAGCVPFSIGSDTWSSITTPAAFTGLTGLRPTYGLVSRRGAMALSWTLDKLGPLCHSAIDCALVLEAIAGPDPEDAGNVGKSFRFDTTVQLPSPLRIGVLQADLESAQPAVRGNLERALSALDGVAHLEAVMLPDLPYGAACWTIMVAEAASAFEDLLASGQVTELTAPEDRIGGYVAAAIPATAYIRAMRVRRVARRAVLECMGRYDAIVAPTVGAVAPLLGSRFSDYYGDSQWGQGTLSAAGNLAGLPAITVPTGFGERNLPTAMQLMGSPFSEAALIRIAALYQEATDWHRRRPPGS